MRLGFWLGLVALLAAVGCGDDAGGDGNGDSSDELRAIAEALTEGIEFDNGLVRRGSIPEASADTVRLSQDDDVLRLAPGETSLMSLSVDNPEDDPVEATLLQFEDAAQHVEVPVEGDAGVNDQISLSFGVDDAICDAFCNKIFMLKMIQAVRLRNGRVSRHLERTFELDCRQRGRASRCDDDDTEPDGGAMGGRGGSGGGGSGGGTGTTTVGRELRTALREVNLAVCMCANPGTTSAECMDAPFPTADVTCIVDAVNADAALTASASCLTQALDPATAACSCADLACYGDAIGTAYARCEPDPELETALEDCNLGVMPADGASR